MLNKTYHVNGLDIHYRGEKDGDVDVIKEVIVSDCYNLKSMADKKPKVIFDIGAHIGTFTCLAKSIWPDAKVFCFEPNKRSFELLYLNTQDLAGVTIFNAALGYKKGIYLTDHADATGGGFMVPEEWSPGGGYNRFEDRVEVFTVEQALEVCGVDFVDLSKWDCENGEVDCFQNMDAETYRAFGDMVGEYHIDTYYQSQDEFKEFVEDVFPDHQWNLRGSNAIGIFKAKKIVRLRTLRKVYI